jgi:hypothetical protein
LKIRYLIPLLFLTGCSWWNGKHFFHKQPVPPEPTQLVVTGAPVNAVLLIDGAVAGSMSNTPGKPLLLEVAPGMHVIEVKVNDNITYRENTYVAPSEQHLINVLSGDHGQ